MTLDACLQACLGAVNCRAARISGMQAAADTGAGPCIRAALHGRYVHAFLRRASPHYRVHAW